MTTLRSRLFDEAHARHGKLGRDDMLMALDRLHRDAVVLDSLDGQVKNGGFQQWVGNGYHKDAGFLLWALEQMGTEASLKVIVMVRRVLESRILKSQGFRGMDDEDVEDLNEAYYALADEFNADMETYLRRVQAAEEGREFGEMVDALCPMPPPPA